MENEQARRAQRLTPRQRAVYDYLRNREARGLPAPSLSQVCLDLGLSSRGSLHKHVQALVEAGLVEPLEGRHHALCLTRTGGDTAEPTLPLAGIIAAGSPIEAVEDTERIPVPSFMIARGPCFVLRVRGSSMIDDGILDGDYVIVEQRSHARDGEIVVALIDNDEATLKRIEQLKGEVVLHPANADIAPLRYPPDRVAIQGVLVGQMRQYS